MFLLDSAGRLFKDEIGRTIFHSICEEGNVEKLEVAINVSNLSKLEYTENDSKGNTPLHFAVLCKNFQFTQMLIEHVSYLLNYDVEKILLFLISTNAFGIMPLHYCCKSNNLQIMQLIINKIMVCINNDYERMKVVLSTQNNNNISFLYIAILNQNLDMVKLLLDNGANINEIITTNNVTPLQFSIQIGNLEILRELLRRGADVDLIDIYGNTALHYACRFYMGNIGLINLLIRYIAEESKYNKKSIEDYIYQVNDEDDTATDIAEEFGFTEIIDYFSPDEPWLTVVEN